MIPIKHIAIVILGATLFFPSLGLHAQPTYLDQGWSMQDRDWFYSTSQGSQLIPYSWFLALERPDSQDRFLSDGLVRFGYLPNSSSKDGLPVGFAVDKDAKGIWLGLTCAACHTNEIRYKGIA